ncbi:transcription-repair coupling factor [Actinobacillus equuli]|nr:transcription-repair coupling factor [Actinobacillus equuli]
MTLSAEKVRKSAAKQNANIEKLPELAINSQLKDPFDAFNKFRSKFDGQLLFSVESEGRRETLLELLSPLKSNRNRLNR